MTSADPWIRYGPVTILCPVTGGFPYRRRQRDRRARITRHPRSAWRPVFCFFKRTQSISSISELSRNDRRGEGAEEGEGRARADGTDRGKTPGAAWQTERSQVRSSDVLHKMTLLISKKTDKERSRQRGFVGRCGAGIPWSPAPAVAVTDRDHGIGPGESRWVS